MCRSLGKKGSQHSKSLQDIDCVSGILASHQGKNIFALPLSSSASISFFRSRLTCLKNNFCFPSLSFCFCLNFPVSQSLCLSVTVPVYVFVCQCLSLPVFVCLFVCMHVPQYLYVCICPYVCLSVCICISVFFLLSISLCLSFCRSLYLSVCLSFCLSFSLHFLFVVLSVSLS